MVVPGPQQELIKAVGKLRSLGTRMARMARTAHLNPQFVLQQTAIKTHHHRAFLLQFNQ
jgi:hypothetical protein